jgi:hypothetical protein
MLLIGPPISDTQFSFRQNLLPEAGGFAVKRKRFSVAVLKQAGGWVAGWQN